MITRRQAIQQSALLVTACAAAPALTVSCSRAADAAPARFKLPPLPYALDALEPHIDARTMEIHHTKHHQAYITNLNKALEGKPDWQKLSLDDLVKKYGEAPADIRMAVRNHAGGHHNHSLFWQMMKKDGGGEPRGELAGAIDAKFGNFGAFKEAFTKAALTQFGSGWAWLTFDGKELRIEQTANQDTPQSLGRPPLLGLDVWEHAYYLKYQNRRPDYVAAFYNVIHWDFVAERYAKLKS